MNASKDAHPATATIAAENVDGDENVAWNWCLAQDRDTLLDLVAVCAALTVDAVQQKKDPPDGYRLVHAVLLASALGLDITAWFIPTAENFFSRISKPQILSALQEARTTLAPARRDLKKAELATLAERKTGTDGCRRACARRRELLYQMPRQTAGHSVNQLVTSEERHTQRP
jgi:hypothetical protein